MQSYVRSNDHRKETMMMTPRDSSLQEILRIRQLKISTGSHDDQQLSSKQNLRIFNNESTPIDYQEAPQVVKRRSTLRQSNASCNDFTAGANQLLLTTCVSSSRNASSSSISSMSTSATSSPDESPQSFNGYAKINKKVQLLHPGLVTPDKQHLMFDRNSIEEKGRVSQVKSILNSIEQKRIEQKRIEQKSNERSQETHLKKQQVFPPLTSHLFHKQHHPPPSSPSTASSSSSSSSMIIHHHHLDDHHQYKKHDMRHPLQIHINHQQKLHHHRIPSSK